MLDVRQLEAGIWSIADGRASEDDIALVHADERAALAVLDRLILEAEDDLESVRKLPGEERDQVVADLTETLESLLATAARFRPRSSPTRAPRSDRDDFGDEFSDEFVAVPYEVLEPDEVKLQASWSEGLVVVWAAARGAEPELNDALAGRLESIGGPPVGWQLHAGVALPGGQRAEALAIPMKDALGWLVAVSGGHGRDGAGPSLLWLSQVALEGVRLAAQGSIVPSLRLAKRPDGRLIDTAVRWIPALADSPAIEALAAAMPGTVVALGGGDGRVTTTSVITAVVEAIITESVERMELPAAPPNANTPTDFADTVIARMDGSVFKMHSGLAGDMSRRFDQWSRTVTSPARPKLIVQLDAPDSGGVWLVSVFVPAGKGKVVPVDEALRTDRGGRLVTAEWTRLTRLLPALDRAGARRRGHVAFSQDEAWAFMTAVGPNLATVGFDVRVPALFASQGHAVVASFRRDSFGLGGRGAPAQQRRLVGVVRRCRAHCGRGRQARSSGSSARSVARPLGRSRSG